MHGPTKVNGWNKRDVRLIQAIKRRQAERTRSLIRAGVDVTKIDPKTGLSAIHVAVMDGQSNIVNLVFGSEHFNVNTCDMIGRTALHCAVQHARSDVTRRIIESQPDMLLVDHNHKSALHYASEGGHLGCVQLLLECNAPVYFKDQDGRCPLSYAAERGQASICRLLLENNADVNETDNESRTSLMVAANANHAAVCDYLLQKGANINLVDNQGRTALDIARLSGNHNEVIKLLERVDAAQRERLLAAIKSPGVPVEYQTDVKLADDSTECSVEQQVTLIPVVVDVSLRHDGCSSEDEIDPPSNVSPTPHVMGLPPDVDNVEPEIDAEFLENLSHLQERGESIDDDEQNGGVRLSRIVEDNLELGLDLVGADPDESRSESRDMCTDQPAQNDVIVESVDDDVERFNIEQMRALIQQLENENSTLRRNAEDLANRRQSLESAKRRLELEFCRLADEQRSMNRGVVELLDAVRNVHGKLVTAPISSQPEDTASSEGQREQHATTDAAKTHGEGGAEEMTSADVTSRVKRTAIELMDSSMAAIQTMILNLAKSEWLDPGQPAAEARSSDEVDGTTSSSATLMSSPLLQLMRLENATLKARLHELAADERRMRRQLDDVERLLTLVDEFKDENRALIDEFVRLKATIAVVERDEAEELEQFADAYRVLNSENDRLRSQLEELTTGRRRRNGTDSGSQAIGHDWPYEEPLAFVGDANDSESSTPRPTMTSDPGADDVDAPGKTEVENVRDATRVESALSAQLNMDRVTELETENRRLLDELERMRHAIDRQTIAMLEMDEDLRRAARRTNDVEQEVGSRDREESIGTGQTPTTVVAGDECTQDDATPVTSLPIDGQDGRQDPGNKDLEKLVDSLGKTIESKNAEIKELRNTVELLRRQDVENSNAEADSKATSDVREPRTVMIEAPQISSSLDSGPRSGPRATIPSNVGQNPSAGRTPPRAPPPVSISQHRRALRQHSDESGITARSDHSSVLTRDEMTYVSETDLTVAAVGCSFDSEIGEQADDFESELSFDLARAMIDCQKVVQENRRLRRELAELRVSTPVGKTSNSTTVPVPQSRGRSSSDNRRGGGAAVDDDDDDLVRENRKLRSYADELESEIGALKRTVKEQSMYLSSVTSSTPRTANDSHIVQFPVELSSSAQRLTTSRLPRNDTLAGGEERHGSTDGEIRRSRRPADGGNCPDGNGCGHNAIATSKAVERTRGAFNDGREVRRGNGYDEVDRRQSIDDVIQSLRRQNASLLEELETTKRGWTEYESFADEYRDKLMNEIERLRNDQQVTTASLDDDDHDKDQENRQEEDHRSVTDGELTSSRQRLARTRHTIDQYRIAADQFYDALRRQLGIEDVPVTTDLETSNVDSTGNEDEEDDAKNLEAFRGRLQRCLDSSIMFFGSNVGRTKDMSNRDQSDGRDADIAPRVPDARQPLSLRDVSVGRSLTETELPCRDPRKMRHTSEADADGGLLEVANLTIDDLHARLSAIEAQLAAARRDNDRLRRLVDEHGYDGRGSSSSVAVALAQAGENGKGPREAPSTQTVSETQSVAATGPQLDADYEEQLLTEIEELRADLRATQRRLREREYEIEETRDELFELNERMQKNQTGPETRDETSQEVLDRDGVVGELAEHGDGVVRRLEAVTEERDQLIATLEELRRSERDDSEKREQQRREELEKFGEIQERVAAENGRLNAELVRCSVERQRAEERCKKLELDCVAFEELSNDMTERWQRLSAELIRLKAASSSSLPEKSSASGSTAEQPETDDDELCRMKNKTELDLTSGGYREVVEENARLKMVLEMERLKNFGAGGTGIGSARVSKADAQTETVVDDSSSVQLEMCQPSDVSQQLLTDTSVTMSGTTIDQRDTQQDSHNPDQMLASRADRMSKTETSGDRRRASDDAVPRRGSLPSAVPSHLAGRESTAKCTIVSVQRAASLRANITPRETEIDRANKDDEGRGHDGDDDVTLLSRLLAETSGMCSTLVEMHCRLVERLTEATASTQTPVYDVDDASSSVSAQSTTTTTTRRREDLTSQRQPLMTSGSSSSFNQLQSLRSALEEHGRRLRQLLHPSINNQVVSTSPTASSRGVTQLSTSSSSTEDVERGRQEHGIGSEAVTKCRLIDEKCRLARLVTSVDQLVGRLPSIGAVERTMTSSEVTVPGETSLNNSDRELETGASLRAKIDELERKLKETENRRLDAVCTYRRHLLSAVQGLMDPNVKEALLCIVKTRIRDTDN